MHFCGNFAHDFIYFLLALPLVGPLFWRIRLFFYRRKNAVISKPAEAKKDFAEKWEVEAAQRLAAEAADKACHKHDKCC